MSVGELNQLMTYVIDGWMLFSAGFIGIGLISFVSRRIQEDIEADAIALANQQSAAVDTLEMAEVRVTQAAEDAVRLEKVAAVSEQLAKTKTKSKQSDSSSVSVST